ncbi:MAG: DUF924 family protein [Hyphomicrobiaceae bacterium]
MSVLALPPPAGEPAWVGDVLHYWFEELTLEQCFAKDDAIDSTIRERFGALHAQLTAAGGSIPTETPRELLAAIVVFDQFSRNLFRGSPRAFAADAVARRLARAAIADGLDQAMSKRERIFLYLPFEHSENAADQAQSVALFAQLNDPELDKYARAHKVIIDRFGRFPHRNAALGRVSTPEEIEFLKEPMSSF